MIVALPDANQTFREITLQRRRVAGRERRQAARLLRRTSPTACSTSATCRRAAAGATCSSPTRREPDETTVYLREATGRSGRSIARSGRCELRARRTARSTRRRRDQPDDYDGRRVRATVAQRSTRQRSSRGRQIVKGDNEMTIAELRADDRARRDARQRPAYGQLLHDSAEVLAAGRLPRPRADRPGARREQPQGRQAGELRARLRRVFVYYILLYSARARRDRRPAAARASRRGSPNIVLGVAGVALLFWRARLGRPADPLQRAALLAPRATRLDAAPATPAPSTRGAHASSSSSESRTSIWPRPQPARPLRRAPVPVGLRCWRSSALLGIFYISTFIDLADKLFRGAATTAMLLRYFYFADAAVRLLHHPDGGAGRRRW